GGAILVACAVFATRYVVPPPEPPSLALESPLPEVTDRPVALKGTKLPGERLFVAVDGIQLDSSKLNFSLDQPPTVFDTQIPLSAGPHFIRAWTAVDESALPSRTVEGRVVR